MRGRASLLLLASLLCTLTLHAVLPTGEFPITHSAPGLAANYRWGAEVATNGRNTLAVWMDERAGWEANRLIATRIDADGMPLDPGGIALGEIYNVGIDSYACASDGDDYLVAWQTVDDDVPSLRLVRIDADTGEVSQIATEDSFDVVGLAWVGDGYALIYRISYDRERFGIALLDRDGRLLRHATFATATEFLRFGDIAAMGEDVIVTWSDGPRLFAARIEKRLVHTDREVPVVPELVSNDGSASRVAANGSNAMVVYRRDGDRFARLLDANGHIAGEEMNVGSSWGGERSADITWNGQHFVAYSVASDRTAIRSVRFTANGMRFDAEPRTVATGELFEVAAAPAIFVAQTRRGTTQMLARRADDSGEGHILSISEPETGLPSVVWRGDHYLSVWLDARGDKTEAVFARFAPDGTMLGAPKVFGQASSENARLAVDTDGRDALVVWSARGGLDPGTLRAALITHDGEFLTWGLVTAGMQSDPAVHWNGSEYLVVWQQQTPANVYAIRISGGGTPLDDAPVAIAPQRGGHRPAIAWNGTHWIVAYMAAVPVDSNAPYIELRLYVQAVQLTRDLVRIGNVMRLSEAEPTRPLIATRNGEVLVVWGTTVDSYQIFGSRIVNGAVLDGAEGFLIGPGSPTSVHALDQGYLVLAYGGRGRLVHGDTSVEVNLPGVPPIAVAELVIGGPRPLIVQRSWPTGNEQVPRVSAHYLGGERKRAVRK